MRNKTQKAAYSNDPTGLRDEIVGGGINVFYEGDSGDPLKMVAARRRGERRQCRIGFQPVHFPAKIRIKNRSGPNRC